jgi:Tfp pilus assembly protein PilE
MKNIKGFTLIEMVIIITIISILTIIGKGVYNGQIERTKFAEAYTTLSTIITAQKDFYIVNKRFAADLEELGLLFDGEPTAAKEQTSVNGIKTKAFKFATYSDSTDTNVAYIEIFRDLPNEANAPGFIYKLNFVANDSNTGATDSFVSTVSTGKEYQSDVRAVQKELDKLKEAFDNKVW